MHMDIVRYQTCAHIYIYVYIEKRFGGRTRPVRFAQFRYASSTTSLSTLTPRDVAVTKSRKQHNNPFAFPFPKPKTTRAQKPKTTNTKKNKTKNTKNTNNTKTKKLKKQQKKCISVLFQNRTRIIHKWRSAEIMFFFCVCCFLPFWFWLFWFFGVGVFGFLVLAFWLPTTIVSIVSTL